MLSTLATDALAAAGVGLVAAGAMAIAGRPKRAAPSDKVKGRDQARPSRWVQAIVAAVCAGLVGLITRWPVAAAWAAVGGWAAIGWIGEDRARTASVSMLDARASWAGLVGAQLMAGRALDVALMNACERAPGILAGDMAALRDQMMARPTAEAVQAWAGFGGVSDAEGRQTACVLMLAASGRGGSVAELMGTLTQQLRAKAASARRVERDRRRYRITARVIVGLTVGWALLGARLDAQLFSAYDSLSGQVLLAAVLGLLALGVRAMVRSDKELA